ncbi:hypothetical protein [Endozoicomonas lisbonensis]|uniref:Zn ribbon nucleic-acid-binding protein n=1 Tax=Endozoicomonas lisbonensis TaxID=3120522 RepID=A0ABV2SEF2_9GAMM
MDYELKYCPLCDVYAAQYQYWEDRNDHVVACLQCGCNVTAYSKQQVINTWNKRPEEEKLLKLLHECYMRFKSYQMDVDMSPPEHHRDFMKRIEAALGT